MTNEELKKKIVEVLKKAMEPIEYGGDSEHAPEVHYLTEEQIADTLIAAGIGDVSSHRVFVGKDGIVKQLYSGEEVDQIVKERDEYKHRAEVVERALLRACKVNTIFAEPDVPNILAERVLYEFYIRQAEEEIAEEDK